MVSELFQVTVLKFRARGGTLWRLAKRRAQAEADLADALLDDAVREQQEAEMQALRAAFSSMRVKQHLPNMPGLWPVDREGEPVDESTLTPEQKRALAWGRNGFRTEKVDESISQ